MREKGEKGLTMKETFRKIGNNLIERVDTVLRPRIKRVAKAKGLPAEMLNVLGAC